MEMTRDDLKDIWKNIRDGLCNLPDGLSDAKIAFYRALEKTEYFLRCGNLKDGE
jgi:hypothetical protein